MSSSKVLPVQQIGYLEKLRQFATHPDTVKYCGRTIMVISIGIAAYFVYKNRSKIYSSCQKVCESVRNKFKRDSSTTSYQSPSNVNIYIRNTGSVTIHQLKDADSEEGKESNPPLPESPKPVERSTS